MTKFIKYTGYTLAFIAIVMLFIGGAAALLGCCFAASKVALAGVTLFFIGGLLLVPVLPLLTYGE